MGLAESFNKQYEAVKENDYVLTVRYETAGYTTAMSYDFLARVMVLRTQGHGDGGATVTPFSQLDREVLVEFREKLLGLKGNPPALPAEKPSTGAPGNKFNL